MVMNNHLYEEQTRRLLSEAQSELNNVETQINELQKKAVSLAREADAYETALRGYLARIGKQESVEFDWRKLLAKEKTLRDKLKAIAKQSGGKIGQSQATDILYSNKLVGAKKRTTAYAVIQGYLADMVDRGILDKVAPGQYQLIDAQQSLDAHRLAMLGFKEAQRKQGGIFIKCPACGNYQGIPKDVANHIRGVFDPMHTEWLEAAGFNPVKLVQAGNWLPVIERLAQIAQASES